METKLKVNVKTMDNLTLSFEVSPNVSSSCLSFIYQDKIESLMTSIQRKTRVPKDRQKLIYLGKSLLPSQTIGSISKTSMKVFIIKLRNRMKQSISWQKWEDKTLLKCNNNHKDHKELIDLLKSNKVKHLY